MTVTSAAFPRAAILVLILLRMGRTIGSPKSSGFCKIRPYIAAVNTNLLGIVPFLCKTVKVALERQILGWAVIFTNASPAASTVNGVAHTFDSRKNERSGQF